MKHKLWIFGFCLLAFQCQKAPQIVRHSDQQLIAKLSNIGQIHNEGLDYALERIKQGPVRKFKPTPPNFSTLSSIQPANAELSNPLNLALTYSIDFSKTTYPETIFNPTELESALSNLIITGSEQPAHMDFSAANDKVISFTYDLWALVESYAGTPEYETRLTALRDQYLPQVYSENDKIAVISGVNVALSSYLYWTANIDEWTSTLMVKFPVPDNPFEPIISETGRPNSKSRKFAFDDAVGAVSGAIRGAVGGLVAGPGGSLAGGILGAATGAVYASVSGAALDWLYAKCCAYSKPASTMFGTIEVYRNMRIVPL